jgi:hypothetical protein
LNNSEKLGTNSIQQQSIFDIIVNLYPFTSPGNLKFSTAAGAKDAEPAWARETAGKFNPCTRDVTDP